MKHQKKKKHALRQKLLQKTMVLAALLLSPLLTLSPMAAQTPTTGSSKESISTPKATTTSDSDFTKWLIPSLTAITAVLGVTTAYLNYSLQKSKMKVEKVEIDLKERLYSSEKIEPDRRRNAILMIGLGGTGKTTFIQQLMGKDVVNRENLSNPDPTVPNLGFILYAFNHAHSNTKYYVADSSGQTPRSLIIGLMEEQKKFNSAMTFGAVNSLIFVLDTAETPPEVKNKLIVNDNIVKQRIDTHINEWSVTALDLIFGLTSVKPNAEENGLRYVCLFINKSDLLVNTNISEELIEEWCRPMIERFEKMNRGFRFEFMVGSFKDKDDKSFLKLKERLVDYSWPGRPSNFPPSP